MKQALQQVIDAAGPPDAELARLCLCVAAKAGLVQPPPVIDWRPVDLRQMISQAVTRLELQAFVWDADHGDACAEGMAEEVATKILKDCITRTGYEGVPGQTLRLDVCVCSTDEMIGMLRTALESRGLR